jgi:hypothetical protein
MAPARYTAVTGNRNANLNLSIRIVSADDTSAVSDLNGNAGISPFQGSWLDGRRLAFIGSCQVSRRLHCRASYRHRDQSTRLYKK